MHLTRQSPPATYALLAAGWMVVVIAADLALPETIVLTGLLSFAPLIASGGVGQRGTAAFGVAAIACAVWSGLWNDAWSEAQQYVRLLTVVMVSIAGVVIARLRGQRDQRYARISAIAEVAQRAILPKLPAESGVMSIASRYESAYEDTLVGVTCTTSPCTRSQPG
jgi:hypothetical protein